MPIVDIDLSGVRTWDDFHDAFASALGFPDFYDRNMERLDRLPYWGR